MRSQSFILAFIAPFALTFAASAQQEAPRPEAGAVSPVRAVVELFTSQGCSTCPPADALLKSYADNPDVVALSLPVDYWDYIGWKDTLASPRNTERQRAYSKTLGTGPVYTPQAVINGVAEALGSNRADIDRAIEETARQMADRRVSLHVWSFAGSIIIEAGGAPGGGAAKEATIWLAVVQKSASVAVRSGENGGKTLTYYNVVREMTPVGLWTGRPATIKLAHEAVMHPDSEDLIVLIQEASAGPIIGAARLGN
jgi:hypothetical protein